MPGNTPVLAQLQYLLADQFDVVPAAVIPGAEISELLRDSLEHTEFVMVLEETFHVRISDKEQDEMVTVDDVLRFLERHAG